MQPLEVTPKAEKPPAVIAAHVGHFESANRGEGEQRVVDQLERVVQIERVRLPREQLEQPVEHTPVVGRQAVAHCAGHTHRLLDVVPEAAAALAIDRVRPSGRARSRTRCCRAAAARADSDARRRGETQDGVRPARRRYLSPGPAPSGAASHRSRFAPRIAPARTGAPPRGSTSRARRVPHASARGDRPARSAPPAGLRAPTCLCCCRRAGPTRHGDRRRRFATIRPASPDSRRGRRRAETRAASARGSRGGRCARRARATAAGTPPPRTRRAWCQGAPSIRGARWRRARRQTPAPSTRRRTPA